MNDFKLEDAPPECVAETINQSFSFLSVCSGIEAASMAWEPLGWKACAFAEIEKFPSAVLAHHWPETSNLGDMTKHNEWNFCNCLRFRAERPAESDVSNIVRPLPSNPDQQTTYNSNHSRNNANCPTCSRPLRPNLIVGGTPCQAFSVAGLRQGLADPRGNLTLVFLGLLAQFRPRWVVWENVPGVLSDKTGAFGAFLGGLGELGYGFAYRVLDAQYFGVPQRRRRVFVVGCLGDWRRAAAVLFEPESLRGDSPPSRQARERFALGPVAGTLDSRHAGGFQSVQSAAANHLIPEIAETIIASDHKGPGHNRDHNFIAHTLPTLTSNGDAHSSYRDEHGLVPATFEWQRGATQNMEIMNNCSPALIKSQTPAVAFGVGESPDLGHCLRSGASKADKHESTIYIKQAAAVRRLTPRECERLQGFPDDHTLIPWRGKIAPDGPRYKALGNSMAVPIMRWIGERISQMDKNQKIAELSKP